MVGGAWPQSLSIAEQMSGEAATARRKGGVDYSTVTDKVREDPRFEREKAYKASSSKENSQPAAVSATFDAFQRMAAGIEGRTITEKLGDPNRPTWEQYKKDNEDKLDRIGTDARKMAEYRAQLDKERETLLAGKKRKTSTAISDSEEDADSPRRKSKKKKSKKDSKKKSKKKSSKVLHSNCYTLSI